jgi:hypothetical protein
MIKLENTSVLGFESAFRGMRNPLNSWKKSDSVFVPEIKIGENDMKLAKALIKAGPADRKFLRMIHVQVDITSSLYFFKEFDTYKISTVADSCSTMHKIHSRDLTIDDFSTEHLNDLMKGTLKGIIELMNLYRQKFIETKDKENWWQIIQMLPSSYNQRRTWDGNYETLMSMYFQRRNHKLDEWHTFCDWILELPYMREFIGVLDERVKEIEEVPTEHMVDNLILNNQI